MYSIGAREIILRFQNKMPTKNIMVFFFLNIPNNKTEFLKIYFITKQIFFFKYNIND